MQNQAKSGRNGAKDKTIEVSIHSALDLKERNWFTEMTPYIVVTLAAITAVDIGDVNHQTQQLRVIATGSIPPAHGKNPLWDLKLTFDIEQLHFPVSKMTLLVTVYSGTGNTNGGSNPDTIIGRVNPIQIEDILPRNGDRSVYTIDTGGTISMTIKYIDKSDSLLSTDSNSTYDGQNNSTSSFFTGDPQSFSSSSSSSTKKISSTSNEPMEQSYTSTSSKIEHNRNETSASSENIKDEELPVATLVDLKKTDI